MKKIILILIFVILIGSGYYGINRYLDYQKENQYKSYDLLCDGIEFRRLFLLKNNTLITDYDGISALNIDNCNIEWKNRDSKDDLPNPYCSIYKNKLFSFRHLNNNISELKYLNIENGKDSKIAIENNAFIYYHSQFNQNIIYFLNKKSFSVKYDNGYETKYKNSVNAFDIDKEKLKWKFNFESDNSTYLNGFYDNFIILSSGYNPTKIKLLNSKTKKFHYPEINNNPFDEFILYGQYILIYSNNELICYDIKSEKTIWSKKEDGALIWNQIENDILLSKSQNNQFRPIRNIIYIAIDDTISALNLKNGEFVWRQKVLLPKNDYLENPIQYKNLLIFVGFSLKNKTIGYHIMDINKGQLVKSIYTPFSRWKNIIYLRSLFDFMFIYNNRLYFRDSKKFRYIDIKAYLNE